MRLARQRRLFSGNLPAMLMNGRCIRGQSNEDICFRVVTCKNLHENLNQMLLYFFPDFVFWSFCSKSNIVV